MVIAFYDVVNRPRTQEVARGAAGAGVGVGAASTIGAPIGVSRGETDSVSPARITIDSE